MDLAGRKEKPEVENERRCTERTRKGRLAKAQQFLLAAETIAAVIDDQAIADAYVTLCVHAGIAAADVICCAKLGVHCDDPNHNGAITLLAKIDSTTARNLRALLAMKTRSGYSAVLTATADQKRAGRTATALVNTAKLV